MEPAGQVSILFKNVYLHTCSGLTRGYLYIEDGVVRDYGVEPKPGYGLSQLVYDFNYKAVVLHGFSYCIKPSIYPYRSSTIASGVSDDVSGYVRASIIEAIRYGVTLPIVHDSIDYIGYVVDTARMLGVRIGFVYDSLDHSVLEKYACVKNIVHIVLSRDRMDNVYSLDPSLFCSEESITSDCILVDTGSMYPPFILYHRLLARGISYERAYELLYGGYRATGLSKGCIEKGVRADILVYSLDDLKKPLVERDPLAIALRGYPPDIVVVSGEVVVEREYSYLTDVKKVIDKLPDVV